FCSSYFPHPSLLSFPTRRSSDLMPLSSATIQRKDVMPGLLQNHIAVVTGSGSGIGRAIALGYAREGAQVVALDINGESAATTAADIGKAGGKAHHFKLDVSDRAACRSAAAEVASKVGQVSILVNNAGISRRNPFTDDPDAVTKGWQETMAVNLNGVFNVTHAFL